MFSHHDSSQLFSLDGKNSLLLFKKYWNFNKNFNIRQKVNKQSLHIFLNHINKVISLKNLQKFASKTKTDKFIN